MANDNRTYFRVSVDFPENRKIDAVGGDAAWLHICTIAYASRNLTDGLVPQNLVLRLSDRKQPAKLVKLLLAQDLWHAPGHDCKRCPQPGPGEYIIHDYLEHQRSAEEAHEARAAMGTGGSLGNHKRWHVARGRVDPECPFCVPPESGTRSGGDRGPNGEGESGTRSGPNRLSIAESESESNRSFTSVDNQSADRSDRVPDDPILVLIIQLIYDRTLTVIDETRAMWIRNSILGAASSAPQSPRRYIEAAITKEPDPRARFLPPIQLPAKPSGCGQCGPNQRLEDPETGEDAGPCPECHPSKARAS